MKKTFLLIGSVLALTGLKAQQQLTNNGNLQLHAGASMAVYGNMANNGTYTDGGDLVTFCGTAAQNISGTSVTTFNHVKLSNALGFTLQQHVVIDSSLSLFSGAFNLNGHTATVNNTSNTAITRTSGYIVSEQTDNSGKIKWKIDTDTTSHIFPFGTASGSYIPFVLRLQSGNIGNVTVSTYHTAANNTPYPVTPVLVTTMNNAAGTDNSANVVDRFWQIDKDGTSGTAKITFTAATSEIGGITNLKAQRWNTSVPAWDAPLPGQTSTSNSVTVSSVSSFSPWTLSGNGSSLPIELLWFTAVPFNNEIVNLDWTTASETDNDYFTVERSADGRNFETVTTVDGAGNSNSLLSYKTTDEKPYSGTSYYRLKQTDMNGEAKYSDIQVVHLEKHSLLELALSPNPNNGITLNVGLATEKQQDVQLTVYNALGHKCYGQQIAVTHAGMAWYPVQFLDQLEPGVYMVNATVNNNTLTKKLIVK